MILYEGASLIDGNPVVAIATFGSRNTKTGGMVQIWIMRADMKPMDAIKSGGDRSICGDCPHRWSLDGCCYVLPFQAPTNVYNAYKRGYYPVATAELIDREFYKRKVRFGAYGDPAAIPVEVYAGILAVCNVAGSTGYTHQYGRDWFAPGVLEFCQISADTREQAQRAQAAGHKTYRVTADREQLLPGEVYCESERGLQCADCGLCNGKTANVVIEYHGKRAKTAGLIPAHNV